MDGFFARRRCGTLRRRLAARAVPACRPAAACLPPATAWDLHLPAGCLGCLHSLLHAGITCLPPMPACISLPACGSLLPAYGLFPAACLVHTVPTFCLPLCSCLTNLWDACTGACLPACPPAHLPAALPATLFLPPACLPLPPASCLLYCLPTFSLSSPACLLFCCCLLWDLQVSIPGSCLPACLPLLQTAALSATCLLPLPGFLPASPACYLPAGHHSMGLQDHLPPPLHTCTCLPCTC